jgi:cell wall-associated NlpC family hydrolase
VLVSDEFGHRATTGPDGSFIIEELYPGGYSLTLSKAGFTFTPPGRRVLAALESLDTAGLAFTAFPEGIIAVARRDIGMPYSAQRGCPSPILGCGGPFNGFYQGGCTDIVIDALRLGADFNLQIALELDFKKHPDHYYQPGNARRAWDMWRYFVYARQVLRHTEPYLPGDVVFFDWNGDGILDHVALVSQVDEARRPRAMIDAPGEINNNPEGLASELPWESFHETSVTGHARWIGVSRLEDPPLDPSLPILLVALDSPTIDLRLLDDQGRAIGLEEASIPGGAYRDMIVGKIIRVNTALNEGELYTLEIASQVNAPYQIGIQIVQGGVRTADSSFIRTIGAGEVQLIHIQITLKDGKINFLSPELE